MRAFAATIDSGSLAAAARKLGHSPATVTRALAQLESHLKTRLLHRNTRALHLTQFGETYLQTCRDVLRALDAAEQGAAAAQENPSGLLTITAPLMFGQLHLRPVLDAFLDRYPAVQARLLLLDRVANLVEEGIDIAVRLTHLPDSTLAATRLGDVRRLLCAAPAYLQRRGHPAAPADLREHSCIMERDGAETELWRFAPPAAAKPLSPVAIRPRLVVNSAAAAIDSALEGHGITRVMSYQAAAAIAAGRLVIVLPDCEPAPIPVHLVQPSTRPGLAKQRAFVAFAAPRLRGVLTQVSKALNRS